MQKIKDRKGERGAALVTVLMLSLLMLVACAGIILEVTMNSANVTDATAEQQAYNAAESGIQSAIDVLRGNRCPAPLLNTTKPCTDVSNRIDFRKAVARPTSNLAGDTHTDARLSRWMNYNYNPTGAASGERVTLGSGSYNPQTGYAFDVSVTDPDQTDRIVSYTTEGKFLDLSTNQLVSELNIGTWPNLAKLVYTPATVNNLDVRSGSANASFGSFRIIPLGLGVVVLSQDLRFQLTVNMKAPYTATKVMRGWIKLGTLSSLSSLLQFDFDSKTYDLMGSKITLDNDPLNVNLLGTTPVTGKITQAEPWRLVIKSTGYGPRGARKILEATIQKNFFNGMSAPATLTLIGISVGFSFSAGQSQNVTYSGADVMTEMVIPPIGTTNDGNLLSILSNLAGGSRKADIIGTPANVSAEMPFWLQSTQNLDATVNSLKVVAKASGRLFTNGQTPSSFGNNADATGITFVEGDVNLSGSGGGILICTGKLTLHGGFDFNGLIVVTGTEGVDRRGGGNGTLQGNVVVAPYNPQRLNDGFLTPKYDISGGGTSTITYNSSSVANGMTAVSNFVLGVAEK